MADGNNGVSAAGDLAAYILKLIALAWSDRLFITGLALMVISTVAAAFKTALALGILVGVVCWVISVLKGIWE